MRINRASNAGADYILSVNENFHIVDKINCIPILIPSEQGNLKSLERIILEMLKRNKDFIADPILILYIMDLQNLLRDIQL